MSLKDFDKRLDDYKDEVRRMNDNRLHAEYHYQMGRINPYTGKPYFSKIDILRKEAQLRGLNKNE